MRLLSLLALLAVAGVAAAPVADAQPAFSLRITVPLDRPASRPSAPDARRLGSRAAAELGAVALTGAGHLLASSAGASDVYIPVVVAGWGGYMGYRAATEPGFLQEVGFTGAHIGRALRDVGALSAGAALGMAAYGAANGSLRLDPSLLPLLVLYPAWGLTQQALVQGFVTHHLAHAGLPNAAVVPVSAVSFGLVHVPNWELTVATTAMGGAFAPLYLRDRNLWPLGVAHGTLGALFYVWVLDRDPYAEIFGDEPAEE